MDGGSEEEVRWTAGGDAGITCNGIRIGSTSRNRIQEATFRWSDSALEATLKPPRIAVVDQDGAFPVTLTRDGLIRDTLDFEPQLVDDILADVAAYLFAYAPSAPCWSDRPEDLAWYGKRYPLSVGGGDASATNWFCTANGVGIADPEIVQLAGCREVLFAGALPLAGQPRGSPLWWPRDPDEPRTACIPVRINAPHPKMANRVGVPTSMSLPNASSSGFSLSTGILTNASQSVT